MNDCKLVSTPLAAHFKLSSDLCPDTKEDMKYMSHVPYANAIGSLMYAMICTRPDLAYVVSMVSRYMHNPGKKHWSAVKWIFRYLKGTSHVGLVFDKKMATTDNVVGYVTQIMLVILIEEDLSQVTSLPSVIVLSVGKQHFNLLLHYLQPKQSIFQPQRE